ncbi:MAG: hypothetical protein GY943_38325, partial [Chloroflexi bacterium]|nr:hypothetical protein [Chloroflexota bacterium]
TNHPEAEILQITVEDETQAEAQTEAKAETEDIDNLDTEAQDTDNDTQQLNNNDSPSPHHLNVTADHPLYIENQGWLNAENLSIGDRLRRADGGMARVLAIERVDLAEPELVYNFTVKGPHTYFVLEVGVLVHNNGVTCAPVKSGNPWRDEQGRFAKTPDFDEEMGVFTTLGMSRELDKTVQRPIAGIDPNTGKPIPLPNRLRRKDGVWEMQRAGSDEWYPAEPRWGQSAFSEKVSWPKGDGTWPKISVEDAAEKLAESGQYPSEMLVFRKLETMKEPGWKMKAFDRDAQKVVFKADLPEGARYFTGDYAALPNGEIIVLNNRTWTVSNSVPLDETIEIPIYWASREEIVGLSYQSDAIDQGVKILDREKSKGGPDVFVTLPSQR